MTESTESQTQAASDAAPARLHLVVGYDDSPPASRAVDAAVRLLRGRDGNIDVVYVAHLPSLDMLSADATVQMEADFDQIEKELRSSAAKQLDPQGVAWEFHRYEGFIPDELMAAAKAAGDAHPGDTVVIIVGSSSHASHRVVGSVAVNLARHSRVPVVIVP
jgi:nucleotide-binding universal stress UspA family protein